MSVFACVNCGDMDPRRPPLVCMRLEGGLESGQVYVYLDHEYVEVENAYNIRISYNVY